jgi:predicted nucleic acid-binding protein
MVQRVVIDTCVFVSALRLSRGASFRVLSLVGAGAFEIALLVPLVLEYEDATRRLGDATGLSHADIEDVIDYLCSVAHLQEIHFLWRPVLRDPRDDHMLELAKSEDVSINQLITAALAEKMSALMTVDYLQERAARGDRVRFERALGKVRDVEPDQEDV